MLLNWVQTGLIWYYFNVIAIAVIIYKLLDITKERMITLRTNRAESTSFEGKIIYRIIVFIALFGVCYFLMREVYSDLVKAIEAATEYIRENYGN